LARVPVSFGTRKGTSVSCHDRVHYMGSLCCSLIHLCSVTNYHVIRNAKVAQVAIVTPIKKGNTIAGASAPPLRQVSNGEATFRPTAMQSSYDEQGSEYQRSVYTATVVGVDPGKDIAVLKVDAPSDVLYPVDIGTSTGLNVGQNAYAIGNRKFIVGFCSYRIAALG